MEYNVCKSRRGKLITLVITDDLWKEVERRFAVILEVLLCLEGDYSSWTSFWIEIDEKADRYCISTVEWSYWVNLILDLFFVELKNGNIKKKISYEFIFSVDDLLMTRDWLLGWRFLKLLNSGKRVLFQLEYSSEIEEKAVSEAVSFFKKQVEVIGFQEGLYSLSWKCIKKLCIYYATIYKIVVKIKDDKFLLDKNMLDEFLAYDYFVKLNEKVDMFGNEILVNFVKRWDFLNMELLKFKARSYEGNVYHFYHYLVIYLAQCVHFNLIIFIYSLFLFELYYIDFVFEFDNRWNVEFNASKYLMKIVVDKDFRWNDICSLEEFFTGYIYMTALNKQMFLFLKTIILYFKVFFDRYGNDIDFFFEEKMLIEYLYNDFELIEFNGFFFFEHEIDINMFVKRKVDFCIDFFCRVESYLEKEYGYLHKYDFILKDVEEIILSSKVSDEIRNKFLPELNKLKMERLINAEEFFLVFKSFFELKKKVDEKFYEKLYNSTIVEDDIKLWIEKKRISL